MSKAHNITIGCVGMTHLGLVHACAFAEKGFDLICYDDSEKLISELQNGIFPIEEPGFNRVFNANAARIHFTAQTSALAACDVIMLTYDVPTDQQGASNVAIIRELMEKIKAVALPKTPIVLLSQVPPGFTRQISFDHPLLFYQVETLIFGRAMERAQFPERYIVGMADPSLALPAAYATLLESFACPILKMRYESAELAKIAINMFLVSSLSTTNLLAEICESIGASWNDIAAALRLDKRLGQHAYLTAGLGIAGGNLERDLHTVTKIGEKNCINTNIVSAWQEKLSQRRDWVWQRLQEYVLKAQPDPLIAILGLAYKPDTHSTKNSVSLALIEKLSGYRINTHDPLVHLRFPHTTPYIRVNDAIKNADVLIIMTAWDEYKKLSMTDIAELMQGKIIIDPYGVLAKNDISEIDKNLLYCVLGKKVIGTPQENPLRIRKNEARLDAKNSKP